VWLTLTIDIEEDDSVRYLGDPARGEAVRSLARDEVDDGQHDGDDLDKPASREGSLFKVILCSFIRRFSRRKGQMSEKCGRVFFFLFKGQRKWRGGKVKNSSKGSNAS